MRNAIIFSVFFHATVFVIGYFGLPYIQPTPILTDTPIMVELVDLAEKTNAPKPSPKINKDTKVHKDKQQKEPLPSPKPKVLPPPMSKEILPVSVEPKPKAKFKAKPLLKSKPKEKKSNQVRKLAKVKPRRRPNPPDSFESILKTVEQLKTKSIQKDKKKNKKKDKNKDKNKAKSFEQQMAQALMSQKAIHNPQKKLGISEIDMIRQQIRECWSLPAGAREAENLSIEIKMAMNSDGTVRQARIIDQGRLELDPFFRAAAESALRAVLNPRCNPLKLPPEKFKQWQNMTLIFDPQKMF